MNDVIKEIIEKYSDDDFVGCIVYGERGYGMSMHHTKTIAKNFMEK